MFFWFGAFLRIYECNRNNFQHPDLLHQVNTSKVVFCPSGPSPLYSFLKIMLVNLVNKSLTGFFLLNIFTHIEVFDRGRRCIFTASLHFSVICCRFPCFHKHANMDPHVDSKTRQICKHGCTHTRSHTNTF